MVTQYGFIPYYHDKKSLLCHQRHTVVLIVGHYSLAGLGVSTGDRDAEKKLKKILNSVKT